VPIAFHPRPGTILICDFSTGFQPPEMVKVRPVVVLSPRRRTSDLVTVVPLSSTPPVPRLPWHVEMPADAYPPARGPMWAKCDVVVTVALTRLDRVRTRGPQGQRLYSAPVLASATFAALQACVKAALGLP
jgi:mRNA interferase MazF